MPDKDYGPLAAALAKAQAAFPAINRDREVTVTMKSGGSYKFKYAPLDTIIGETRQALAANGLAITQLIDSDPDGMPLLVTRLLHESGAYLEGHTPIPGAAGGTPQEFGSAITYMRRYAITALLGVATEEDDDGNHASGNGATFKDRPRGSQPPTPPPEPPRAPDPDGLIGTVEVGKASGSDFLLRQTPDGMMLGFRLKGDKGGIKVVAVGAIAEQLADVEHAVVGKRVTCWGRLSGESWTPKGTDRPVTYQVLALARIRIPDVGDLPRPAPMFSSEEDAELDRVLV